MNTNTEGFKNTAIGSDTMSYAQTSSYNVAIGAGALEGTTTDYVTGDYNVAVGVDTMSNNTTGELNVAMGYQALRTNQLGNDLVAIGANCMRDATNTQGNSVASVAVGYSALQENTGGKENTAIGYNALKNNTDGIRNTALGTSSGQSITTGDYNTALGYAAMPNVTTSGLNVAIGSQSQNESITGSNNVSVGHGTLKVCVESKHAVAVGYNSMANATNLGAADSRLTAVGSETLSENTTGMDNTAIGRACLEFNTTGSDNTGLGSYAMFGNTTGSNNTALGSGAMNYVPSVQINNVTCLGANSVPNGDVSNQIVLGDLSIDKLSCKVELTVTSDARLKTDIRDLETSGLDFVGRLRPVTFEFMGDGRRRKRLGFLAQEVLSVEEELGTVTSMVDRDNADRYGLQQTDIIAYLVKAVQELQSRL